MEKFRDRKKPQIKNWQTQMLRGEEGKGVKYEHEKNDVKNELLAAKTEGKKRRKGMRWEKGVRWTTEEKSGES